ncbi:MAG: M15 family metallopeptidase [Rhizomicrobium sp.]
MIVFGALGDLRTRPIPHQAAARARRQGFRGHPIARSNAHYGEDLLEVRSLGIAGENYYYAARNPPYWRRIDGAVPDLMLRRSVAEKLARVAARLAPAGLELFVFDAWRPRAVQAYFHDVWMPAELQRRDPSLAGAALTAEIERYWAAPSIDENSPAPHATGAAVDLTIRWQGGEPLWMGSIFDDATALAHRDRFEDLDAAALSFSDEEARANRRLLHWLMAEEGFAGHPDEWWHFSWGDQMWAVLTGEAAAHYGLANSE